LLPQLSIETELDMLKHHTTWIRYTHSPAQKKHISLPYITWHCKKLNHCINSGTNMYAYVAFALILPSSGVV